METTVKPSQRIELAIQLRKRADYLEFNVGYPEYIEDMDFLRETAEENGIQAHLITCPPDVFEVLKRQIKTE